MSTDWVLDQGAPMLAALATRSCHRCLNWLWVSGPFLREVGLIVNCKNIRVSEGILATQIEAGL
jgi:hypothetical protein